MFSGFLCRSLVLATLGWLAFDAGPAAAAAPRTRPSEPIRVESGAIAGAVTADGQVRVFKGIPYAAPPVGNLRWRAPQPVAPWHGIRQVTEFAPACPQAPDRMPFAVSRTEKTSEDCLYLNVWAPARPSGRHVPVMVWIHGGAFTHGAASLPIYDGESLARHGAVVVTINYRLGPFGFLAHPLLTKESGHEASGNYGLLDQIAALRWVKANIRSFRGSVDRVTVLGESAGAVSIGCLLVSPQAHGLFHSAVMESGTPFNVTRYLRDAPAGEESMEEAGELIARRLGCDREDDVLAALRARSTDDILSASRPAAAFFGDGIRFGPIIDRWLIPDRPAVLFAAQKQLRVPLLVGANSDEGALFVAPLQSVDADTYRRFVRSTFRDRADDVLARFPAPKDGDAKSALSRLLGYGAFVAPARRLARYAANSGDPAYLYSFTHGRFGRSGASHGAEIPFVFGTLARLPRLASEVDDGDRVLSAAMMGYWLRFATTGDPNGDGAPVWPRYNPKGDPSLEFGDDITAHLGASRDVCDFFDRVAADRVVRPTPKR
ncbi:MAG TPA: carboxylesterase/lipase family protein [Vicinamibacterales bacterium]